MALRIDSHAGVVRAAGKEIADVVLKRIAKLLMEKVRTEDSWRGPRKRRSWWSRQAPRRSRCSRWRSACNASWRGQGDYRGQPLRFATSFGVASLSLDRSIRSRS